MWLKKALFISFKVKKQQQLEAVLILYEEKHGVPVSLKDPVVPHSNKYKLPIPTEETHFDYFCHN